MSGAIVVAYKLITANRDLKVVKLILREVEEMKKIILGLVLLTGLSVNATETLNGRCTINQTLASHQGSCSHHQGVCGCGGYRLRCCDGTLSPSCPCAKEDSEKKTVEMEQERDNSSDNLG